MRISDWSSDVCSSDLELAFAPDAPVAASGVAVKHAHSKDNPEADWGRHVKQAAQFALHALDEAVPDAAPFTFDNTRVIAVGISTRSEEHTSELQSLMRISYAVFCLNKNKYSLNIYLY